MKNIILTTIALLFLGTVYGQNVIDRHFSYLADAEDATHINVSGKMFEMMNSISVEVDSDEDEELNEMKDFLGSIRSFELVAAENVSARSKFNAGNTSVSSEYEELIRVTDKEGKFYLYIDESNDTVHEVVGVGTDNEKLIVFSLMGDMKLEHVGKVAEHINHGGMGQLDKVKDLDIDEVSVYPNPATTSGQLTLETSDGFVGGIATMYDNNGKLIKTYKITDRTAPLDISDFDSGNYILTIEKHGVTVRKKVLIVE